MGKYQKTKGTNFEVKVAKAICDYFGLDEWQRFLPRCRIGSVYHSDKQTGGQIMGDLFPSHEMVQLTGWRYPIECKHQQGWTIGSLLVRPQTSKVYKWFLDAREEISPEMWPFLLIFAHDNSPILVMHQVMQAGSTVGNHIYLDIPSRTEEGEHEVFYIEHLRVFLQRLFPNIAKQAGRLLEEDGLSTIQEDDPDLVDEQAVIVQPPTEKKPLIIEPVLHTPHKIVRPAYDNSIPPGSKT